MDEVEGARSLPTASDEADHVCGPCKYEDEEEKATRFCNDCKEFLCPSCSSCHRGQKISRNHTLIPIEWPVTSAASTEPSKVFCECNRNNVVSVYCEDHENVICRPCSTLKHIKCNIISISKKTESYSGENFKFISQQGDKIAAEIDEYVNCRKNDMQSLENMKEKCVKDIKAFRQEINENIDTLEKESIEALKKQELVAQQDIEQHLPACVSTKEMLQTDMKLIDDIQKSSSKTDMFSAEIFLSNRFKEYENCLQDIIEETDFPNIYFEKNDQLNDTITGVNGFGRIVNGRKPNLFTDLKIVNSSFVDIKMRKDNACPSITGCALMPGGKLVLCDFSNKSIKVLGDNLQTYDTLAVPSSPFDVSVINDTCVIITLPNLKQLQYIQVVPTMEMGFMVQLDQKCFGIDVVSDEMYVACHDGPGNGKIKILDINGILKRTISLTMYDMRTYITVNAKSGNIYISDKETSTVACLMPSGKVIYKYKDKSLVHPRKSCLDEEANILVCGESSDTVQIITAAGNKHSTLLTATDGIRKPLCAVYKQMDKTLIVTCNNNDKLYIFRTK